MQRLALMVTVLMYLEVILAFINSLITPMDIIDSPIILTAIINNPITTVIGLIIEATGVGMVIIIMVVDGGITEDDIQAVVFFVQLAFIQ
jgi:hypothetical protein